MISVISVIALCCALFILIPYTGRNNHSSNRTSVEKDGETYSRGASTDALSVEDEAFSDAPFSGKEQYEPLPDAEETDLATTLIEQDILCPESLCKALSAAGITAIQLEELKCHQLITIESSGMNAKIDFYSFNEGAWSVDERLSCSGFVGSNGVSSNKIEGDYATPVGLFSVGDAFYINSVPDTGLNTFQVTDGTYWVDDPDSPYYNQHIEGYSGTDWASAEHMIDYPSAYEFGFVVNYNAEAEYNSGSAIFFHVSYGSTAGCIGTDRESVVAYLAVLQADLNPYILIF